MTKPEALGDTGEKNMTEQGREDGAEWGREDMTEWGWVEGYRTHILHCGQRDVNPEK